MDRENDTGEETSEIFLEGESGDRGATSLVAAGTNVGNGHAYFESNIEDEQLSDEEQTDQTTNDNLPSAVTYARVKYPGKGTYAGYFQDKKRHGQGTFIDIRGNRYDGAWKDDRAHGYGKKTFKKTGDVHEGYYVKDKRQGWGMYIWANGDKYVGNWHRGIMQGEGTFIWARGDVYQGCWEKGKMTGKGVKKLANGDVYDGEWKDDQAHGYGIKRFQCGDIHEGNYANDRRCGPGKYTWPNGDQFEGCWLNGKMNGRGRKRMSNGDVYIGDWKNDKAHGFGIKKFACGDRHEGEYMEDRRCGYGVYVWANGDRFEGQWKDGKMSGKGVKIMSEGDRYDGQWEDDRAHGWGIKYFRNGDRHEGMYVNDRRDGFGVYEWANGDMYEGMWHGGEQCGKGIYKYKAGDIFTGVWVDGQKHGDGTYEDKAQGLVFDEHWQGGGRVYRRQMTQDELKNFLKERESTALDDEKAMLKYTGHANICCNTITKKTEYNELQQLSKRYLVKARRALEIATTQGNKQLKAPSNVSGGYPSIKTSIPRVNDCSVTEDSDGKRKATSTSLFPDDDSLDIVDIEIDEQQNYGDDGVDELDDDSDYFHVVIDNNHSCEKGSMATSSNNANNAGNVSARKRAAKRTLNDRSSASLNGSGLVDRVHVLRKLGSHPVDVDGSLDSFEQLSVDSSLNNTKFEEGEDSNGPDVQNVNDISAISDRSEDDIDDL